MTRDLNPLSVQNNLFDIVRPEKKENEQQQQAKANGNNNKKKGMRENDLKTEFIGESLLDDAVLG